MRFYVAYDAELPVVSLIYGSASVQVNREDEPLAILELPDGSLREVHKPERKAFGFLGMARAVDAGGS